MFFVLKPFVLVWKAACWFVEESEPPTPVGEPVAEDVDSHEVSLPNGSLISDGQLAELAIQTWRLERRIESMDPDKIFGEASLSDGSEPVRKALAREKKKLADSSRRLRKFLETFDVEYEDLTGKRYDPGLTAVEVLSWDEPDAGPVEFDVIKETIRPLVRKQSSVIKIAQVVCVEGENQ